LLIFGDKDLSFVDTEDFAAVTAETPAQHSGVACIPVPEALTPESARSLLSEIKVRLAKGRFCLVIDCTGVREVDCDVARFLVSCLEEAMKRNGDVRLAGIGPTLKATWELGVVRRLFEVFDTVPAAVDSFYQHSSETVRERIVQDALPPTIGTQRDHARVAFAD
jgi:anti-sigma B factor antagonist